MARCDHSWDYRRDETIGGVTYHVYVCEFCHATRKDRVG